MKVFISYAHADQDVARRVTQSLRKNGLSVWSSEDEIVPGIIGQQKWRRALRRLKRSIRRAAGNNIPVGAVARLQSTLR